MTLIKRTSCRFLAGAFVNAVAVHLMGITGPGERVGQCACSTRRVTLQALENGEWKVDSVFLKANSERLVASQRSMMKITRYFLHYDKSIMESETLMSALEAMQEKNALLEKLLIVGTCLKLVFSQPWET